LKEYQENRNMIIVEFFKQNKILTKDFKIILNEIFKNFEDIEEDIYFNSMTTISDNNDNNELNTKCLWYENCYKYDFKINIFKVISIIFALLTLVVIIFFLFLFFANEFWYKKYLKLFD
jgi:hypothetical protein